MTSSRQTSTTTIILLIAATSWAAILLQGEMMASELPFLGFVGMWAIMMAAMMLPSFAPIASRYINMIESQRWIGISSLAAGYMGVWSIVGVLAYLIAQMFHFLTRQSSQITIPLAVSIFAMGRIYQFTPLKDRCLTKRRTPFAQLLEYASWKDRWRHFRVGAHHGAYCAGCCWSLMLVMFAFGTMNIGAMAAIAIVVAAEKLWTQGRWFSYAIGAVCLMLAVAVIWLPQLAPGLTSSAEMMNMP
jgi:predicted metal-binding membrane protein